MLQVLIVGALLSLVAFTFHRAIYHPYFIQSKEDQEFLSKHPTWQEVLAWFPHKPLESLREGEQFRMTGWRPLPTRAATGAACSFVRSSGHKIYVFFDAEDRVEEFVISKS